MQGVTVFPSLREALNNGFQQYDKTPDGYLVRRNTPKGYEFALVVVKEKK